MRWPYVYISTAPGGGIRCVRLSLGWWYTVPMVQRGGVGGSGRAKIGHFFKGGEPNVHRLILMIFGIVKFLREFPFQMALAPFLPPPSGPARVFSRSTKLLHFKFGRLGTPSGGPFMAHDGSLGVHWGAYVDLL